MKNTRVTFTPEQIKKLAKQHHCELIHIVVFLDSKRDKQPEERDKVEALVKDPLSLDNLQMVTAIVELQNNVKKAEYVLDNLMVEGDDMFKLNAEGKANNARVRFTGGMQAINSIDTLDAAVVKH